MKLDKKAVLVPWDFTALNDASLQHAVNIAKALNNEIVLIHVVKSSVQKKEAIDKLTAIAQEAGTKYGITPKILVKEGTPFSTISEIPNEIDSSLFVMKTDGISGMQKYRGSNALRVVVNSPIPFIVIQKTPTKEKYENIVFPIDHTFECKEKLHWVKFFHKLYGARFQLISPDLKDEIARRKVKNNMIFAKNILNEESISYEIIVGAGKGDFTLSTMEFSNKVDADLILTSTTKDIGFREMAFGAPEQKVMANPFKIPVMAINPRNLRKYGGFS